MQKHVFHFLGYRKYRPSRVPLMTVSVWTGRFANMQPDTMEGMRFFAPPVRLTWTMIFMGDLQTTKPSISMMRHAQTMQAYPPQGTSRMKTINDHTFQSLVLGQEATETRWPKVETYFLNSCMEERTPSSISTTPHPTTVLPLKWPTKTCNSSIPFPTEDFQWVTTVAVDIIAIKGEYFYLKNHFLCIKQRKFHSDAMSKFWLLTFISSVDIHPAFHSDGSRCEACQRYCQSRIRVKPKRQSHALCHWGRSIGAFHLGILFCPKIVTL